LARSLLETSGNERDKESYQVEANVRRIDHFPYLFRFLSITQLFDSFNKEGMLLGCANVVGSSVLDFAFEDFRNDTTPNLNGSSGLNESQPVSSDGSVSGLLETKTIWNATGRKE